MSLLVGVFALCLVCFCASLVHHILFHTLAMKTHEDSSHRNGHLTSSGVACFTPSYLRTASILEIRCSLRAKKKKSSRHSFLFLLGEGQVFEF